MHDRLVMSLQDDLTSMISDTEAKGVLIDISALEIVDSFIGRMLAHIAAMTTILDARTVVVGMRPAVAITLVELGMSLPGVQTGLNVEKGMRLLRSAIAGRSGRERRCPRSKAESFPIATDNDIVIRSARSSEPGPSIWASAWSIRPRRSRRPASWRGIPWSMAGAARCSWKSFPTAVARGSA